MSLYELIAGTPAVDDYRRLRLVSGLSEKTQSAAEAGLPNTWFAVIIRHGGDTVGMGRVIGDGGTAFQIVDIAVEPAHQGRGLGKKIVAALVDHLRAHAPASAYVSLIADGDAQFLYAQYGFAPVAPASIGMALRID
ncbi:GNAT family N-acetyltransferase [Devosia sp.]|uniref:GNAT family N-acetyltransferase n=1 Tax=Devosia sp. TaxID=1871048 RepID=UPI002FC9B9AB